MSCTNEDPSSKDFSSPRIPFSHDLNPSNPQKPHKYSSSLSNDFDFSLSIDHLQSQLDPVPADEIFSDGMIPPLPLKISPSLKPAEPPTVAKKSVTWRFGRSSSLNLGGAAISRIRFLRSRSAGSANPNPKSKPRLSKSSTTQYRKSRERRITSPVLPAYFPKERNGMGVIELLLCSCGGGGGGGEKRMEYYCSP